MRVKQSRRKLSFKYNRFIMQRIAASVWSEKTLKAVRDLSFVACKP